MLGFRVEPADLIQHVLPEVQAAIPVMLLLKVESISPPPLRDPAQDLDALLKQRVSHA